MTFNINKAKNYLSYFFASFIPLFTYFMVLLSTFNVWFSLFLSILTFPIAVLFGRKLSHHPFRDLIENTGVLMLTIDSRGLIRPYILEIHGRYLNEKNGETKGLFDRDLVVSFVQPKKIKVKVKDKTAEIDLNDTERVFSFEGFYPTFIYNEVTNTFLDKKTLNEFEMKYLTRYNLNYLKTKIEELGSVLRDFARYVVELSKPKPKFWETKKFFVFLAILIAIILLVIGISSTFVQVSPPVQTLQQTMQGGVVVGK